MGAFYTNLILFGVTSSEVVGACRELRREAFVIATAGSKVVVFDEACDSQDTDEIESFGCALSERLSCEIVGVLNHDDDHLLLWRFSVGEVAARYSSIVDGVSFSWSISRVSGGFLAYPFIAAVLSWPTFIFQTMRHSLLARIAALPSCSVGFGHTYLSRGEIPPDTREDEIQKA